MGGGGPSGAAGPGQRWGHASGHVLRAEAKVIYVKESEGSDITAKGNDFMLRESKLIRRIGFDRTL